MADYRPNVQEKEMVMDRLRKLFLELEAGSERAAEKVLEVVSGTPKAKILWTEKGASSIEYTLLVVLIACVAAGAFAVLGDALKGLMDVANKVFPF